MSTYRVAKEYRLDLNRLGRSRFLSSFPNPVLLTANPHQGAGSGYYTRPKTGSLSLGSPYAQRIGFMADETYLVIPIVKAEGRPFPERIGVGRTRATDIILLSNDVSKYHAYFTSEGDRWFITDANSSNGTFVNGERLAPMAPVRLEDGALIALGGQLYQFRTAAGLCSMLDRLGVTPSRPPPE